MVGLDKFTKDGKYLMLALDHRGSFKKLMNPNDPEAVSKEDIVQLKKEIIKALEDQFSGLLIDQDYGLPAYLSRSKPFLLPVEKSGYSNQSGERITELQYSVQQIISQGASGAKLLLYFNPDLSSAEKQLETGEKVLEECDQYNFPFFLEMVTYKSERSLASHLGGGNVVESVKRFIEQRVMPDVWKLEYPGSLKDCQKVTELVGETPWILLTRGDSFEHFVSQLKDATDGGAQGFLAGRALWQEACRMEGEEKEKFLSETLPERFRVIAEVVRKI